MGFDAAQLEALNPRLIVASVNGYGSSGPYVDRPSFDFIAQAMSGFMSVNGPPGIVCALQSRERSGHGQQVESSLTGGLISMLAYLSAQVLATGTNPERTGNDHPIVAPYGLFEAADGQIAVSPSTDTFVERFLRTVGLQELLNEAAYCDNAARMSNRAQLNARINEVTRTRTVDEWIAAINAAGCPCGRVMELDEVFRDPQVLAQEMVIESQRAGQGTIRMTGFPVKLSATPCELRLPPPELGEHTAEYT